MRSFFLLFFFNILVVQNTFSQDGELQHTVGLKSGWLSVRFSDKVISNYVYAGGTIPIQLDYTISNKKFRSSASFIFKVADSINTTTSILNGFSYAANGLRFVDDTVGDLNHHTVQLSYYKLDYSFSRRVDCIPLENFDLYLGGGFNFTSINKKFLSLDYTNILTDRIYTLGFVVHASYKIKTKHVLQYGAFLPLGARTHRVLYLQYAQQDADKFKRWTLINQSLVATNFLSYTYMLGKHFSVEGRYQFSFQRITFPREELLVSQSYLAGFNFHF